MPPVNMAASNSARSALDASGSIYHASGDNSPWTVNMGGTAPTLNMSGAGGLWIVAAVAAGVMLWQHLKK